MGYYDQDYPSQNRRQKGNRGGYFLAALTGVIIGALLVMVAFPRLGFGNNGLKGGVTEEQNEGNTERVQQNVELDVTSAVTEAADKAGDAVVGITNIQQGNFWQQGGEAGTGSGVLYEKVNGKAYIATNHHVVEGANELEVTLPDGKKLPATLKGSDVWTDLAVIEVDAKEIGTVAEFGKSAALKPGEPVIAIGNPLGLQFSGSVTQGIISGVERTIEIDIDQDGIVDWNAEVIQTDAAINPGNSGGALVNLRGQVIGINSMKIAQSAVEGIGLSIPIDTAIPIIEDLEKYGEVKRPYMGVELAGVEEISQYHQRNTLKLPAKITSGVAITSVRPNSPAARAGLKEFDVIVEMDGEEITDIVGLRRHLYNRKDIGDELKIKYYRGGKVDEVTMTLTGETF
ncbi:PDZ domain-containing protein [Peribacillus saganii]|uniref:PDZ domain-containing protein n=1 Tax=Peribacillus saganii TaxID=2303992 RepID=A0A372LKM3_9BACI|nr:trypsin-like peptidase domain-containing protein [Peribacillus saganii]RFU67285.1 PDZ domain-containing protein [Peribacillus saganii]